MRSALAGDPVLANAMTSASVTLPPASGIVGLQVGSRLTQVQHPGAHLGRRQHRGSDEARNVLDLQVIMVRPRRRLTNGSGRSCPGRVKRPSAKMRSAGSNPSPASRSAQ